MNQKHYFQKIVSILLVLTFAAGGLGGFVAPRPARAFLSVPVAGDGGGFDRVEVIGTLERIGIDDTQSQEEITQTAATSVANGAYQELVGEFDDVYHEKLGIENPLYYEESLVENKYMVDVWMKYHGADSVPAACQNGDSVCVGQIFENLPIRGFDLAQIPALAATGMQNAASNPGSQAEFSKTIQQLIVGASSLFTSGLSCGGLDGDILSKATTFLATASSGVIKSQIDPSQDAPFYEAMTRLGNPLANRDFWALNLKDLAIQQEGRARAAANLEITSPGLKATQQIKDPAAPGSTPAGSGIERTLSLIQQGEANTQGILFNVAVEALNGSYSAKSFKDFILRIVRDALASWVMEQIGRLAGRVASGLSQAIGAAELGEFQLAAQAAAKLIAQDLVRNIAVTLFNKVAGTIFQGEVLAESTKCRQGKQTVDFTAADRTFTEPTGFAIPAFGEGGVVTPPGASSIIFEVPPTLNVGETAVLAWDASALGAGVTVTLNGGRFFNEIVEPVGSRNDTPVVTTTYTLTVTGPGINQSVSRTVTINTASISSQVQFDVQPRSVFVDEFVEVSWDATAMPNADVQIFPISVNSLPASGVQSYQITGPTTFTFTAIDPTGANPDVVRSIRVQVINSVFGFGLENSLSVPFRVRE